VGGKSSNRDLPQPPSPRHAKSIALILSLSTGNVSPQYLVQFYDLFEIVTKENEQYIPNSEW
jgi:hypothetical protein